MSLISVEHLCRSYRMGEVTIHALDNISIGINHGDFVAIMGPSGSGKSTFMNVLGCLDKATSGSYVLDGTDVGRLNRDQLADIRNQKIGFVFQSYQLLPRATAVENVELPLLYSTVPYSDRRPRAIEALREVGMDQRLNYRPNQLSGGQQQRIAIARALINHPEIIMADEPTGALDSKTGIEVMAIFQRLNRDRHISILLVTHEPDIAQYADRIIHFKDGRIVRDRLVRHPFSAASQLTDQLSLVEAAS